MVISQQNKISSKHSLKLLWRNPNHNLYINAFYSIFIFVHLLQFSRQFYTVVLTIIYAKTRDFGQIIKLCDTNKNCMHATRQQAESEYLACRQKIANARNTHNKARPTTNTKFRHRPHTHTGSVFIKL